MKTIGIIGGMSPESTVVYYREINRRINAALGGHHSAKMVLFNVQYQDIKTFHHDENWAAAGDLLAEAGLSLKRAGADFLVLATNTMHLVASRITEATGLPLLHIGEVTADRLVRDGVRTVGLTGTRFTMERAFYRQILADRGLEVVVPEAAERDAIHRIINDELISGVVDASSRRVFQEIIRSLKGRGCEAVILGCTEIGLLISPADSDLTTYDTALLHIAAAADHALR
jgi:aspartate racemase